MRTQTGEPALAAKGLTKRFKSLVAVDGVDVTVGRGECFALLGPNGAGKTTTVEMLEGLVTPDAGTIEIFGSTLAKDRRKIMEKVGVLLQETNLYKRFTVRETLELFASFFAESLDPEAVIARLALTDKADSQLRTLSGGQKQRAYLGCALINDPALLFLDEPTTGLDPQARRAIWELLAELKREGRGILLTTHYMEEAEVLADRVAIIDHGKIIAEGTPRQLIRDLCGEQVLWVSLTGDAATCAARLGTRLPWFVGAKAVDDGYEVTTTDAAHQTRELFEATSGLSIGIKSLQMRSSTLEDVFLKLTGRSMRA